MCGNQQQNKSCKMPFLKLIQPRSVKKFSSSRLIMNRGRLWNSHQRHKFLRAKASRDILKFRVSEMAFPAVFSTTGLEFAMLFHLNTGNTGNNAIEMLQAFHVIERFTDLNLLNMRSVSFKTGTQIRAKGLAKYVCYNKVLLY